MPDFNFLLGGGYKPPEIDVYAPYKQALTLRQLADAREYQRAMTEKARLKAMQERQEMAEMESFRREYKPGMAPDEVMRRWPTYGPKALTAQGQALTQQRLAATQKRLEEEAQARLDKAAAEKQEKIRQQVANIGMQAAGLENKPQGTRPDFADLSPREQFFNTQVAGTLIDQGITPAEQFGAFQMPQDMAAAKRAYGAAYGADKVQTYEAGEQTRKNTALEILGKQWEDVSRRLEGVTGQPSWTKLLGELPPEIASQFKAEFSPPELARAKKMALGAAQRQQAMPNNPDELIIWMNQPGRTQEELAQGQTALERITTYHQSIRPSIMDSGGLVGTVMQNPGLFDQLSPEAKAKVAPDLWKAGFTGFTKPNEEFKRKTTALKDMDDAISMYKTELDQIGPQWNPDTGAKLNTYYQNLLLRAKELFNLGVLNGNDYELLQKVLSDPSGLKGNVFLGKSGLLKQIEAYTNIVNKSRANLQSTYQPQASAPPAGTVGGIPNPVTDGSLPSRPATAPAKPRPPLGSFYR